MAEAQGLAELEPFLEELRRSTARDEETLRLQHPDGDLGQHAESTLALFKAERDPTRRTLRTWAYIKHLFWAWNEGLQRSEQGDGDKTAAAQDLLAREPVEIELENGRVAAVTGRSYQALAEIARHSLRIQELEEDVRRAVELEAILVARRVANGSKEALRRYRRVALIHGELLEEAGLHRRAIYAHLFTPTGAPASSIEDAPTWWEEITPEDDRRFMRAVWEVGAGRYAKLGETPLQEESGKKARTPRERFGWHSHFAQIERQMKLEPASLRNRDLYQHLTWLRAAADAPPDIEEELE